MVLSVTHSFKCLTSFKNNEIQTEMHSDLDLFFVLIMPEFVFQGFFRKRKTSNLEAYVSWFNRLSYLVATEICMVSCCDSFWTKERL